MILLFGLAFVAFFGWGAQADWLKIFTTEENSELQCYRCSSLNATEIVAGAGVDPGLFLSTIQLDGVPITHRCKDRFDPNDALRTGITAERCDDGLCVKINYTDKYSHAHDVLRACLPKARGVFKESCDEFHSRQAVGIWCVCGKELCNSSLMLNANLLSVVAFVAFLVALSFRFSFW